MQPYSALADTFSRSGEMVIILYIVFCPVLMSHWQGFRKQFKQLFHIQRELCYQGIKSFVYSVYQMQGEQSLISLDIYTEEEFLKAYGS